MLGWSTLHPARRRRVEQPHLPCPVATARARPGADTASASTCRPGTRQKRRPCRPPATCGPAARHRHPSESLPVDVEREAQRRAVMRLHRRDVAVRAHELDGAVAERRRQQAGIREDGADDPGVEAGLQPGAPGVARVGQRAQLRPRRPRTRPCRSIAVQVAADEDQLGVARRRRPQGLPSSPSISMWTPWKMKRFGTALDVEDALGAQDRHGLSRAAACRSSA